MDPQFTTLVSSRSTHSFVRLPSGTVINLGCIRFTKDVGQDQVDIYWVGPHYAFPCVGPDAKAIQEWTKSLPLIDGVDEADEP